MTDQIEKVEKVNEKDNMVSFGYNLSLINLLFFILLMVLAVLTADAEEGGVLSTVFSILMLIHVMSNVLTFAFGLVGVFGSSKRGRALVVLCLSIITFLIYLVLIVIYVTEYTAA